MSQYDDRGFGRSRAGGNPLADFDAFRARRVAEQEADGYEATASIYGYADEPEYDYRGNGTGYEPTRLVGGSNPPPEPTGKGKLRSTAVFLGMVVFVAGLGGGIYAATRSAGGTQATAAAPPLKATPSAGSNQNMGTNSTATPNANTGDGGPSTAPGMKSGSDMDNGMGMGSGQGQGAGGGTATASPTTNSNGRTTLTMLSVVDVGTNAFTAITARGVAVTVQVDSQTQFGTQTQQFSPSDVVPGSIVWAKLRRDVNGNLLATLITGTTNQSGAMAAPTGNGGGGTDD